jgi:ring-1,2-phenylacetyl-CoA epoxidase subunit PaaD
MVTAEQHAIAATAGAAERGVAGDAVDLVARAWSALAAVADPEVPAVSVVELGIVRNIEASGPSLRVEVTPTYSGCPATDAIMGDIEAALDAAAIGNARLETRLSPPWTTDWIAPEARRKLREFGIAPPHVSLQRIDVSGLRPTRRRDVAVPCPRCGATRTRLLSQFGSTACKAQYRCDACLEPFDYFKPH